MNKDLESFLTNMNFTNNEIEDMKTIAPTLDNTSLSEVESVMRLLAHYGYPKEDLPELFYQNPNIMTLDKNTLKSTLDKLVAKNIDIEKYLKNNPFAI